MRALVVSDLHADWVTGGYPRFDDVARAGFSAVTDAIREKVDLFLFLGDLSDPDTLGVLRAAWLSIDMAKQLNRAGIRNFWVAGNHDVQEDGSGATTLRPLMGCGFEKTNVFEQPAHIDLGSGIKFLALPYCARANAYDPEDWVPPKESTDFWIVGSHLQVPGAEIGSETEDMPRGRDVAFPLQKFAQLPKKLLLNGHYHKRQKVTATIKWGTSSLSSLVEVHIPGSAQRLTFGGEETNTPGYCLYTVNS